MKKYIILLLIFLIIPIFAHTGINGRDWQKGLSSDYKDMMKNFKKRHNNGNNSIPEY
jgi:hypothetical protein